MCYAEPLGSFPENIDLLTTFENATEVQILEWDRKFRQNGTTPETLALLTSLCFESLDQAFCTSFYDPAKKGAEPPTWLFSSNPCYRDAFSKYSDMVMNALKKFANVSGGAMDTLLSRACFGLRWVPGRPPLPLMTASFLKAVCHVLDKSKNVIEEVSLSTGKEMGSFELIELY